MTSLARDTPSAGAESGPREGAASDRVPLRTWIGFFAMVFGMFMAILDIQIVASSLSEIQAGLSASADEISWIQTSYLIAEVIMIPLSGFLARLLSTRWLFAISCAGFTLTSLACAFAWNLQSMIVLRALQGFIGGAMIPTVFAASFITFPPSMRAGVSVMIGLVATMAPTLGPTLGGWLTEATSWHWLFLINVPPGIAVTILVFTLIRLDQPNPSLLKGFDVLGVILVALFLGSLEYVVEEGPRHDWLSDDTILTFAVVMVVAGILFFWREFTYDRPVIDLRAFANRNFAVGCVYSFIIGFGLYGSVYLVPVYLGQIQRYNALDIGLTMMVVGVFQMLSAPLAGFLSQKIDLRLMLAAGLSLFGLGIALNAFMTVDFAHDQFFWPQAIRGLSLMLCFLPINTIALGTLPHDKLNNASGLYNLMRNLGGAIGLAGLNTILIERQDLHYLRLSENVTVARPGVTDTLDGLALGLDPSFWDAASGQAAALKMATQLAYREAMIQTFNDAFLIMSAVFFAALLLMPFVRKVTMDQTPEGAH